LRTPRVATRLATNSTNSPARPAIWGHAALLERTVTALSLVAARAALAWAGRAVLGWAACPNPPGFRLQPAATAHYSTTVK